MIHSSSLVQVSVHSSASIRNDTETDLEHAGTGSDDAMQPRRLASGESALVRVERAHDVDWNRFVGESRRDFVGPLHGVAVHETAAAAANDPPRWTFGERDAVSQARRRSVRAKSPRVERPQLLAFAPDLALVGDDVDLVAPVDLAAVRLVAGHRDGSHPFLPRAHEVPTLQSAEEMATDAPIAHC